MIHAIKIRFIILILVLAGSDCIAALPDHVVIRLANTASMGNSGLLQTLLAGFEQQPPFKPQMNNVGTRTLIARMTSPAGTRMYHPTANPGNVSSD